MENITWSWIWRMSVFVIAASGMVLLSTYTIYIGYIFLTTSNMIIGGIFYEFVTELSIIGILSGIGFWFSYIFFKKKNGFRKFRSFFVYFKEVYNGARHNRNNRLSMPKKMISYEKWRLSYYKSLIFLGFIFVSLSIFSFMPTIVSLIYVYYPYFYASYPYLFFILDLFYTMSFSASVICAIFIAFYMLSRKCYVLSPADTTNALVSYSQKIGKDLRRNTTFPSLKERKSAHMDIWLFRLFATDMSWGQYTAEEKNGIREFLKNLKNFDIFLMTTDRPSFKRFSRDFKRVALNLTKSAQPQIFLRSYIALKKQYEEYIKKQGIQFNSNRLFDVNKEISLARLGWEFRNMTLQNILTIILIIILGGLYLVSIFVFHNPQLPSFPGL